MRQCIILFLGSVIFRHVLIHLHQFGNTFTFGHLDRKSVSLHNSFIVGLVGFSEFGGHGGFVIEVGKRAVGIFCTSVKNSLCRLFNFSFLFGGGVAPRKIRGWGCTTENYCTLHCLNIDISFPIFHQQLSSKHYERLK